jgi:hypothetical protein
MARHTGFAAYLEEAERLRSNSLRRTVDIIYIVSIN